jgi:hypothetical protein
MTSDDDWCPDCSESHPCPCDAMYEEDEPEEWSDELLTRAHPPALCHYTHWRFYKHHVRSAMLPLHARGQQQPRRAQSPNRSSEPWGARSPH